MENMIYFKNTASRIWVRSSFRIIKFTSTFEFTRNLRYGKYLISEETVENTPRNKICPKNILCLPPSKNWNDGLVLEAANIDFSGREYVQSSNNAQIRLEINWICYPGSKNYYIFKTMIHLKVRSRRN